MYTLLRSRGLSVSHESPGKQGTVAWWWTHPPDAFMRQRRLRSVWEDPNTIVLHQIRHPLPSIASLVFFLSHLPPKQREKICRRFCTFVELPPPENMWKFCASFWLRWNQQCEEAACWSYRVEDLILGSETYATFCDWCGLSSDEFPDIPRDVNSAIHAEIYWRDLEQYQDLCQEIRSEAARWGYDDVGVPSVVELHNLRDCSEDVVATIPLPSLAEQASHYGVALVAWVKAGRPVRDDSEVELIFHICEQCPKFVKEENKCSVCGCNVKGVKGDEDFLQKFLTVIHVEAIRNKAMMATESCPKGEW